MGQPTRRFTQDEIRNQALNIACQCSKTDDLQLMSLSEVFCGGEGWEDYKDFLIFLLHSEPQQFWPPVLRVMQTHLVEAAQKYFFDEAHHELECYL